jgi:hypothetical protein
VGKRFNAAYIISVWDKARQFLSARAETFLSLMKLLAASVTQNLLTVVPMAACCRHVCNFHASGSYRELGLTVPCGD